LLPDDGQKEYVRDALEIIQDVAFAGNTGHGELPPR
jgi:hypothetical protein